MSVYDPFACGNLYLGADSTDLSFSVSLPNSLHMAVTVACNPEERPAAAFLEPLQSG